MSFDDLAEYYIENGWGKRIEENEALRLLALSEELGRVAMPDNAQDVKFVCLCCSCCCGWLKNTKMLPNPAEFLRSNYIAVRDADSCTACLTCVERCPMEAVVETEDSVEIDLLRCIGCGVCLSTCPEEAITLVPKEPSVVPPSTFEEKLDRIMAERDLA
jgi:electron transport complex protein RnfB